MDDAILDLLRRGSGLGLDGDCRWTHRGEAITHERTVAALNAGLSVRADGEVIVRIGSHWAYVQVEDTPYVVRNVRVVGDPSLPTAVELLLSDGTRELLDPASLRLRGESAACRVKGGAEARLSRAAWHNLLPLLVPPDDPAGPVLLRLSGGDHPVAQAER